MLKNVVECNKYKDRNCTQSKKNEEYQYLNLIQDILSDGTMEYSRNGNTKVVIGSVMHFSLENGKIPILTTKRTAWKTCLKELLFFIRGSTDNKILTDQKVHIWDKNTDKEFLKMRGLSHYTPGRTMGPLYGFQHRYWNAEYTGCTSDYTGQGIDQLADAIRILKDPLLRSSRRIVISAWNPEQIDKGVLPPCHILFIFSVTNGDKLSCTLTQRSVDTMLGCPFNIASYSFLTHLIAKHCDLEPYEFIHNGVNVHIYEPHIVAAEEQITRIPFEFPTLTILNKRDNINDYVIDDFEIENYQCHAPIKMDMVA